MDNELNSRKLEIVGNIEKSLTIQRQYIADLLKIIWNRLYTKRQAACRKPTNSIYSLFSLRFHTNLIAFCKPKHTSCQ